MEKKGLVFGWRAMGRVEKAFLLLLAAYLVLYFSRVAPPARVWIGLAAFLTGLAAVFKLARWGIRKAIWRLRNRLIIAYLFIAVVPIVLLLLLVAAAGWAVIGTMAVYLVDTDLSHRENQLLRQAEIMARFEMRDTETAVSRFVMNMRNTFPNCEVVVTGSDNLKYPADSQIEQPPSVWQRASGLITKGDGADKRLYVWAHATGEKNAVTILAPLTPDVLSTLIPRLGDVSFYPLMGRLGKSHVPPPANTLDFELRGGAPVSVPAWESPKKTTDLALFVDTRLSAVLGIVFGQRQASDFGSQVLAAFTVISVLFLIVEIVSLVTGIRLTRTITGAVHELYLGTLHVKGGDFAYRIPVQGKDQLAELSTSFNTMTENLGRLIVVAKEKERLESELAIAREVQNQLFPKDVPSSKTLELKGVCKPARMVSGDYYDFISLSDGALAFAIGDVAGKGISAALLMATIQSTMRTQLGVRNGTKPHFSTAALVANLNKQLYATTAPEKYATFYFALYDDPTHSLTYTNAGHLSPLLLRGNAIEELGSNGTVVGAFPFARYGEKTVPLEHGDVLVAYTDGIVEPENAYGEMFGDDRLRDLLLKYERADSSEMIARTMEAVTVWTGSGELQDDMTMVVARRI
jgi:sigma-B regulation protein RsbU (phosphoserine phosphatase)